MLFAKRTDNERARNGQAQETLGENVLGAVSKNQFCRVRRWGTLFCSASVLAASAIVYVAAAPAAQAYGHPKPLTVTWMQGYADPGIPSQGIPATPSQYNEVGVIKIGPSRAKNVLVLEPGTSAAAAYFVPLAKWVVSKVKGWQVWAVQRRENLLEDQSELNAFKDGQASATQLFDYYLGYLKDSSITDHYEPVANSSVEFASDWGMNVAVQDLRAVILDAESLGGKVVLGGHSLGGSVVTAYATWDFDGTPGADGLSGLLYIDGGSGPGSAISATQATEELDAVSPADNSSAPDPWLAFGGIAAPYAGIFVATGAASALYDPDAPNLGQSSGILALADPDLVPQQTVSNVAQFGYALNSGNAQNQGGTSPSNLLAAQAHLGTGITTRSRTVDGTPEVHGWDGADHITPISRFAEMFAGAGVQDANGSEWYFPQRLTDDTGAVNDGIANPAQSVLEVDSTMGDDLPTSLKIYAFDTVLGGVGVIAAAQALASQSGIPSSNLTLVNASGTSDSSPGVVNEPEVYSHNDPAGAYPDNYFFDNLVPFLNSVSS
jgi:pimeloyl-ACP methyl ester carboxylesterase